MPFDKDMSSLKVIPFYTGAETLEEVLKDKKSSHLLWLEILLNDTLDWESYLRIKEVRMSYEKACIWYTNFRTLLENYIHRKPLERKNERIDKREYRKFLEALTFVSS